MAPTTWMTFGKAAAVLGSVLLPGPAAAAGAPDAWAWKHRLLVIFAPDPGNAMLAAQRQALEDASDGFSDRHMVLVEVIAGKERVVSGPDLALSGSALKTYAGTSGDTFEVLLFGKDTGLKLRSSEPVASNDLFALIDTMPMRRQEMRKQKN